MRKNRVTDVANAKRDGPIDYGLRSKRGIFRKGRGEQSATLLFLSHNLRCVALAECEHIAVAGGSAGEDAEKKLVRRL